MTVSLAWKKEPVERLQRYLTSSGQWDEEKEKAHLDFCSKQVEEQVNQYLDTAAQLPETMFDYMFENIPHDLALQREYLINRGK